MGTVYSALLLSVTTSPDGSLNVWHRVCHCWLAMDHIKLPVSSGQYRPEVYLAGIRAARC